MGRKAECRRAPPFLNGITEGFMYPHIDIFGRTIPTYGLMAVIGFLLALVYAGIVGHIKKLKTEDGIYVLTFGMVGVIIGAKFFYLILVFPSFIRDLPMILQDFQLFFQMYFAGGMVFYGGLFGAIIGAALASRFFGVDLRELYPIVVPAIPLIAGFGRIGCFLTGCCYGKETHSIIGVVFTQSLYAPNGVSLIPTQLIECFFDLGLFMFLIFFSNSRFRDYSLRVYLLCYAVFRIIIEFFRGDDARGFFLGISTSQWVSLIVIAVIFTLAVRRKKGTSVLSDNVKEI